MPPLVVVAIQHPLLLALLTAVHTTPLLRLKNGMNASVGEGTRRETLGVLGGIPSDALGHHPGRREGVGTRREHLGGVLGEHCIVCHLCHDFLRHARNATGVLGEDDLIQVPELGLEHEPGVAEGLRVRHAVLLQERQPRVLGVRTHGRLPLLGQELLPVVHRLLLRLLVLHIDRLATACRGVLGDHGVRLGQVAPELCLGRRGGAIKHLGAVVGAVGAEEFRLLAQLLLTKVGEGRGARVVHAVVEHKALQTELLVVKRPRVDALLDRVGSATCPLVLQQGLKKALLEK